MPFLDERNAFFTSEHLNRYKRWSCQNMCEPFFKFGTKLYRRIVSIPMGTTCAPLIADLCLFCCLKIKKLKLSKHLTLYLDI